jgi:hypothetical protein
LNRVLQVIIGFTCVFFVLLATIIIYGLYQTGVKIKQQEQAYQKLQQQRELVSECNQKAQPLMTGYPVPRANVDAYNAECGSLLPLPPGVVVNLTTG